MATQAQYSWIPSTARVICVDGFGIVPRGTLPLPNCPLIWPAKDPNDVLDYVFDISEAIAGNEGDAVATLDVQIAPANPGDLILQSSNADGNIVVLWLAQGLVGTTYAITITVGTNSRRVISRTVNLSVVALATPPVQGDAITDQTGAPILTQNNQTITTT